MFRLIAACAVALLPGALLAQSAAELESRLPSLRGLERAGVLSKLVDAYRLDQPNKALERGTEALALLEKSPDPRVSVATLNEMAWAHMTLGHYDSATVYGEKGRRLAQTAHDTAGQARALSNLGTLAQRMGDPNHAVELFTEALVLQRAAHADFDAANSLNNLGFVYSTDLADYSKSLSYHLEALAARQQLGDKAAIALSLNNIGIVYGRLRQPRRALEYYAQALDLRRQVGNQSRIAATLNNIGDTYFEIGDLKNALAAQQEALSIRAKLGDRSAIALSHHNLGLIQVAMNRLAAARAEFDTAERIARDAGGDRGLLVQVQLGRASVERRAGNLRAAQGHADRALALADSMGSREYVRRASDALASIQEEKGELSGALATLRRSKAVSDSIFSVETARQIAALEQRYQDERRAREVEALRRNEAELELAVRKSELQRNGIATVAVLLLIAGASMYRRRIDRLRLVEQMSVTDSLTGVRNRRYLEQTIERDLASSVRRYRAAEERGVEPDDPDIVFFLLDLDGFKQVNDNHGHAIGDRLLTELAKALERTARDSDVVVRWGGDEFLVIGRFMDHRNASIAAARMAETIANHVMVLESDARVSITCSIGYASFPFSHDSDDNWPWRDLIRLADIAAYSVKDEGGNGWAGFLPPRRQLHAPGDWTAADVREWTRMGHLIRESSRAPATSAVA